MTREEILRDYNVENDRITDSGKFENEPIYAPYFYDAYLNGFYDDYNDAYIHFDVTDEDIARFPELIGIKSVHLYESDCGFVSVEAIEKISGIPVPDEVKKMFDNLINDIYPIDKDID